MNFKNRFFAMTPTVLVLVVLGCNLGSRLSGGGSDYTSAADKFAIAFPGGSTGVETGTEDAKFATSMRKYEKNFDNRSDNYRSYEVMVAEIGDYVVSGKDQREILEIGLNGWAKDPDTVVKDVTINGHKAIDSVRTIEIGPAKMSFREAVVWSEKEKKMYILRVAAVKKENVSAKEADDFVNSLKLSS